MHNQSVVVTGGAHSGKRGNIVSVEALSPEPVYLVELDWSNGDARFPESALVIDNDSDAVA